MSGCLSLSCRPPCPRFLALPLSRSQNYTCPECSRARRLAAAARPLVASTSPAARHLHLLPSCLLCIALRHASVCFFGRHHNARQCGRRLTSCHSRVNTAVEVQSHLVSRPRRQRDHRRLLSNHVHCNSTAFTHRQHDNRPDTLKRPRHGYVGGYCSVRPCLPCNGPCPN